MEEERTRLQISQLKEEV